jgi:hypothetical protein
MTAYKRLVMWKINEKIIFSLPDFTVNEYCYYSMVCPHIDQDILLVKLAAIEMLVLHQFNFLWNTYEIWKCVLENIVNQF